MESPYAAFRRAVLTRLNVAQGYSTTKEPHDGRTDKVIAAAALVIAARGPQWCLDHPQAFAAAAQSQLSLWIKLGITLASVLIPGGSLWVGLLAAVIPAVLDLLHARSQSYGGTESHDAEFNAVFAAEARTVFERKS